MLPKNSVFIVYEVTDVCTEENKSDDLIVLFRDNEKPEVLRKSDKPAALGTVPENKTWRFFHTPPDNNPFRRKPKNPDPSQGAEAAPMQYRCGYDQCGKRFETKFELYKHLSQCDKKHSLPQTAPAFNGNKRNGVKYTCPSCNDEFRKVQSYTMHLSIHSRAEQYKCSRCTASFRLQSGLCAHMHRHRKMDLIKKITN